MALERNGKVCCGPGLAFVSMRLIRDKTMPIHDMIMMLAKTFGGFELSNK
jgi:hypothetical protein